MNSMNPNRLSNFARETYRATYPHVPTVGSTSFVVWMNDNKLAPRDVAQQIGCTPASVTAWSRGERVPTIELARRIELLCGIPVVKWVEIVGNESV